MKRATKYESGFADGDIWGRILIKGRGCPEANVVESLFDYRRAERELRAKMFKGESGNKYDEKWL